MHGLRRFLLWTAACFALLACIAWWASQPPAPDAFYRPPAAMPAAPGALLRQAAFHRHLPADARAWRILYTTTRMTGVPAVASAMVVVSRTAPPGPRPVIAWAHGTTGVVPGCAPSLLDDPFDNVPALPELLAAGWVFVGTDYVGLGTSGPSPYLIGDGEARSLLDSVRAARQMTGVALSGRVVVWGHSQGGNAALWTGILQPAYAQDVPLAGIAAIAPASDLQGLVATRQATLVGRIISSFIVRAYSETYPDVTVSAYTYRWTRALARDIAGRCLAGPRTLFSVAEAWLAGGSIFAEAPDAGALGARLAQNTPITPPNQPLLIAQGLADDLVLPSLQTRFVDRLCHAGATLEYRRYAGRDHLSVVTANSPLIADLLRWTQDRLNGVTPRQGCQVASR